jgi:hypothetical protein
VWMRLEREGGGERDRKREREQVRHFVKGDKVCLKIPFLFG